VAGKSLTDSGLLALSGLKLLWISRKGALLFKAAPEEPQRKLPRWLQFRSKAGPSGRSSQGNASTHTPLPTTSRSTGGAAGATNKAGAADAQGAARHVHGGQLYNPEHLTVMIDDSPSSSAGLPPGPLVLQVCVTLQLSFYAAT